MQAAGNDIVVLVLNELQVAKEAVVKTEQFEIAGAIEKARVVIGDLQILNADAVRKNKNLLDQKRAYFAGMAMQAMMTTPQGTADEAEDVEGIVERSFYIADIMNGFLEWSSE